MTKNGEKMSDNTEPQAMDVDFVSKSALKCCFLPNTQKTNRTLFLHCSDVSIKTFTNNFFEKS